MDSSGRDKDRSIRVGLDSFIYTGLLLMRRRLNRLCTGSTCWRARSCFGPGDSDVPLPLAQARFHNTAHRGRQIKHVLKMDPEAALKTGNPGPEVELAFWKSKVPRRSCIHHESPHK